MKNLMFLGGFLLVFSSCSKKDDPIVDNERPVIAISELSTLEINPGDTLVVDNYFTDNLSLNQARFDLHIDDDGHTHQRSMEPFHWEYILNLNGTAFAYRLKIPIASDAEKGAYHFSIVLLDEAGNESIPVIRTIHIE